MRYNDYKFWKEQLDMRFLCVGLICITVLFSIANAQESASLELIPLPALNMDNNESNAHEIMLTDLDWNSDNNQLAVASTDGFIYIWDVSQRSITNKLGPHRLTNSNTDKGVDFVAWQPHGSLLLAGMNDLNRSELWLWNTETVSILNVYWGERYTAQASWSPDGTQFADPLNNVWHITDGLVAQLDRSELNFRPHVAAWSPAGDRIAIGRGWDVNGQLAIFNAVTGERTYLSDTRNIWQVSWQPDGQYWGVIEGTTASDIVLIDAMTGQLVTSLEMPEIPFYRFSELEWRSDSRYIATMTNMQIFIWHLPEDEIPTQILPMHTENVENITAISWNPDGSMLAAASSNGKIYLWETR